MGVCGSQVGQGVGFSPGGGGAAAAGNAVDGGAGAVWTPLQIPDIRCWLAPYLRRCRWQEDISAIALTQAAADGDAVGQIDDPSNGKRWVAPGASRKPALKLPGTGRAVSLSFAGGTGGVGNNNWDHVYLENSKYLLGFLSTLGIGTVLLKIKPAEDSNDGCILDCVNGSGSGSPNGFFCQKDGSGALQWATYNGSGTAAVVNAKTPNTSVVAAAWNTIKIKLAGPGANHVSVNINGTNLSMAGSTDNNLPSGVAFAPLTRDLYVGQFAAAASSTTGFNGEIGDIVIVERAMDDADADWLEFLNWNPAEKTTTLATSASVFLTHDLNFSDSSRMRQEHTSPATAVAAGDRIGTVLDQRDTFTTIRYNSGVVATATDTTRPLWSVSAVQNGLRAADFQSTSGAADLLNFVQAVQKRGRGSAYALLKTNDVDEGSHLYANGNSVYVVLTNPGYAGNPSDLVWHGGVSALEGSNTDDPFFVPNNTHLIELHWAGSVLEMFSDGVGCQSNPKTLDPADQISWATLGTTRLNREFKGWIGRVRIFNDDHAGSLRSTIRAAIAAEWGHTL